MSIPVPKFVGAGAAALTEQPDSPQTEYAEIITKVRRYRGTRALAEASALPRGTIGTGDMLGWVVQKSNVKTERGAVGLLEITWTPMWNDPIFFNLPPDELTVEVFEVNPPVEHHPLYKDEDDEDMANVRVAIAGATSEARDAAVQALSNLAVTNPLPYQLYVKRRRGLESYYLAGFKYAWTRSYWLPPDLNQGGYLEAPGGPLAGYFPGNLSWLRLADQLQWNQSFYKYTRTWMGGPDGHWDSDLYQQP